MVKFHMTLVRNISMANMNTIFVRLFPSTKIPRHRGPYYAVYFGNLAFRVVKI